MSFLKEETVRLHDGGEAGVRELRLGMAQPSTTDDGWWICVMWAADDGEVVSAIDVAPRSGPPPGPPLLTLGPALTGALSGLIAQEGDRQALRLRLPPAQDEGRPWDRALMLQVALKWEPFRSATMTANEQAREVLRAFASAISAAGHPTAGLSNHG